MQKNDKRFTIALAEDRDAYRRIMATYLEGECGWGCFDFKYAEYLMDWLGNPDISPPDIIVMDIVFEEEGYKRRPSDPQDYLPMNGYMATKIITDSLPHQCIVLLTGSKINPTIGDIVRGFRLGAIDFMMKPTPERPSDEFLAELSHRLQLAYERKQKEIQKEQEQIKAEIAAIQHNMTLARGLMHQSGPRLSTALFHIREVKHKVEEDLRDFLETLMAADEIKSSGVLLKSIGGMSKTSDSIIESVDEAQESLAYIDKMVKQFNGESFEQVIGTDEVPLQELLKSTLQTAMKQREYLRGDSARFHTSIDDRGIAPVVIGSREWLAEVFMAIFSNAFEAMENVEKGELAVEIGYERIEDVRNVKVIISDNGCGILPENLSRIFEPFFTTKPGRGMGIGLSFAKAVFEAHGGFITANCEEAKGTVFSVYLPEQKAIGTAR